jgi:hypothetical protein
VQNPFLDYIFNLQIEWFIFTGQAHLSFNYLSTSPADAVIARSTSGSEAIGVSPDTV